MIPIIIVVQKDVILLLIVTNSLGPSEYFQKNEDDTVCLKCSIEYDNCLTCDNISCLTC